MTKAQLVGFRKLRLQHLTYGIGTIRDKEEYFGQAKEVIGFADELDGVQRTVYRLYYVRALSTIAIGIRLNCSDRNVRRILGAVHEIVEKGKSGA